MRNNKMILIDEADLKSLIKEAVNDAVDKITKKIASKCATLSYNNEIFSSRCEDSYGYSCGSSSSGCGTSSSIYEESYGCGSGSSGGCGTSSSYRSYSYGCGSGPSGGSC